jgi:hypothetical protein
MLSSDHIRVDPVYREALRACELDSVERILSRRDGRVVAWSRTTDTLHVPGADGGVGFFVKRYRYPTWRHRVRCALRGAFLGRHRGQSEYRLLNEMRAAGVSAVRPVAYGARRCAHFVYACFLITEEVLGAVNLTSWAQSIAGGRRRISWRQRRAATLALARQMAFMHAANLGHGEAFWRNLLIRQCPQDDFEFFFLDPRPRYGGRRFARQSGWWLMELAQLAASAVPFVSRSDRLRFYRAYASRKRLTADDKRSIRAIERIAGRWAGHERQRIHMNALFERWNVELGHEPTADWRAPEPIPVGQAAS